MTPPPIATVVQLRDYLNRRIEEGFANRHVLVDRRGLHYLKNCDVLMVGLGLPPEDDSHSHDAVFVRAAF